MEDELNYGIPSWSTTETNNPNEFGFAGLYNDLMGFTSQERTFAHDEKMLYLEDKLQNPKRRMQQMIEAGINPNTASGAIAGQSLGLSGTGGSASPVASPASEISSLASIPEKAANSQKLLADAELAKKNAGNADSLAQSQILERAGAFAKSLTEAGGDEIASTALALSVFQNPISGVLALFKGDSMARKFVKELRSLDQQYENTKELFEHEKDLWPHEISIMEHNAIKTDWEARRSKSLAEIDEQRNQLRKRYASDPDWSIQSQMADIIMQYGEDSPQYKALFTGAKQTAYAGALAGSEASWYKMPSNMYEAMSQAVHNTLSGSSTLSKILESGVSSVSDLFTKVRSDKTAKAEFDEAFEDAKSDLYNAYRSAKRKYKEYRFSGASDSTIAQYKAEMENCYKAYKDFTPEIFSDELIKSISPK